MQQLRADDDEVVGPAVAAAAAAAATLLACWWPLGLAPAGVGKPLERRACMGDAGLAPPPLAGLPLSLRFAIDVCCQCLVARDTRNGPARHTRGERRFSRHFVSTQLGGNSAKCGVVGFLRERESTFAQAPVDGHKAAQIGDFRVAVLVW